MIKRYQVEEIQKLWEEENKFKNWWLVELYNAKALKDLKLENISEKDISNLEKNISINLDRIYEIEKETKHDVFAFLEQVKECFGQEQKWIHFGLTSTDVVDTALAHNLKQVNEIISKDLDKLLDTLKSNIKKYKDTYMMGRTHGVHAEVTTFGYKLAYFYDQLLRSKETFLNARKEVEQGKISGAVGNYANIDPRIQDYVCKELGIGSSKISTQVLSRDRHSTYLFSISLIAKVLEEIATEFRHLQKTETREVLESFTKGQKGSSAMPHKKNPISSENITGLSRLLQGYVMTGLDNIPLWHERDISHSSNERVTLPDATNVISYLLRRMNRIIDGMYVDKEKMLENIKLTNGACFSQRVMLELITNTDMNRMDAYEYMKAKVNEAYDKNIQLSDLLKEDKNLKLNEKQIDGCFDLTYYSKNVDLVLKRLKV